MVRVEGPVAIAGEEELHLALRCAAPLGRCKRACAALWSVVRGRAGQSGGCEDVPWLMLAGLGGMG